MFRMFWYEIKMDFLRSIRYRFGMISDLLVYFALFTVFMVTDSGNSYAANLSLWKLQGTGAFGICCLDLCNLSNFQCRGIAAE